LYEAKSQELVEIFERLFMQKYREHDGGRRNWDARDLGRNLA
ncbi:unnamed protein product, partial [Heterotrigona itama]